MLFVNYKEMRVIQKRQTIVRKQTIEKYYGNKPLHLFLTQEQKKKTWRRHKKFEFTKYGIGKPEICPLCKKVRSDKVRKYFEDSKFLRPYS